jgi:hypothetical protein
MRGILHFMKSSLILILLVALALGAFLSRPSEASFRDRIKKDRETTSSGVVGRIAGDVDAELYAKSFQYRDHYLWTSMDRNGKSVYTGVFGHWFGRNVNEDLKEVKAELKTAMR